MSGPSPVSAAATQLADGDASTAFDTIQVAIEYPATLPPSEWGDALDVLAKAATELFGEEWDAAIAAAAAPDDPAALGTCGSFLIEQGFAAMAAGVLARAAELDPASEGLLAERVTAHEQLGDHQGAVRILDSADASVMSGFLPRYLLAFNAMMSFDPDRASSLVGELADSASNDTERFMAARVQGMLVRLDALEAAGFDRGDRTDLQGWHLIRTAGLLLTPGGEGAGDGRGGRVTDTLASCASAIQRVRRLLDALGVAPPTILTLPDDSSQILGAAAAEVFGGLQLVSWPDNPDSAGLVVGYDLERLRQHVAAALVIHEPQQVLWAHAVRWTIDNDVTADITSFVHQSVTPPWADDIGDGPASAESVATWSKRVVEVEVSQDHDSGDDRLVRLAEATRGCGDHAAGVFRAAGRREKQFAIPLVNDPF